MSYEAGPITSLKQVRRIRKGLKLTMECWPNEEVYRVTTHEGMAKYMTEYTAKTKKNKAFMSRFAKGFGRMQARAMKVKNSKEVVTP